MKITEFVSSLQEGESIDFSNAGRNTLKVRIIKVTPANRLSILRCVSFAEIQRAKFDLIEYEIEDALKIIRESAAQKAETND